MAEKVTIPITNKTKVSAPTSVATKLNPAVLETAKKTPVVALSRDAKDINITYAKGLEKAIGVTRNFIGKNKSNIIWIVYC